MAKIALKVDVDTLLGTQVGTPNLAKLFAELGVGATFLFSLGPDHTGWALKRVFRPGFLKKVSRTSVVEHYGIKTLLYGVLLPAPDIGKRAANEMRAVDQAGHETGFIHGIMCIGKIMSISVMPRGRVSRCKKPTIVLSRSLVTLQ